MNQSVDKKQMISTKRIAFIGVLSAVYVLLSLLSIGTNDFKVSLETMTILVSAIILGPVDALFVGIVGELIHQLLLYGLDGTTALWILPYAMEGLIAGLMAKGMKNPITRKNIAPIVIVGELILTLIITPVNALSAYIQGWGNWVTILGGIPLRLAIMGVRIVIYILVLPGIVGPLTKLVEKKNI